MWTRGYDWDDIIHDQIISRIRSWYGQLRRLGGVQVPRCLHDAKDVLGLPMQSVIFYSDSMDILRWIQGHGQSFRPYVADRIGEIQMVTEPSE